MSARPSSWLRAAPLLLALSGTPAFAQAPAAAPPLTTEAVRTEVQKYLDLLDAADSGRDKVDLVGRLEVTQEDRTFKVRLPTIVVTAEGMPTTIPPMVIAFRPINAEQVDFSVELPSPITVGPAEAAMLTFKIGSQSFTGTWNPAIETWPRLDMKLSDISITSPMLPTPVTIKEIVSNGALDDAGNDVWGGHYIAAVRGLDFKEPESGIQVTLGEFYWDVGIERAKMRAFYDLAEKAGMTVSSPDYMKNFMGQAAPDPAKMMAILRGLPELIGGMSYKIGAQDVAVRLAPVGDPAFEMKSASGLVRVAGGENLTELTTTVEFDGLTLRETGDAFPPELIPNRFVSSVTLDRVPAATLWAAAMDLAQSMTGAGAIPGTAVPIPDAPVAAPEPVPEPVPRGTMPEGELVEKHADDYDSGNPKEGGPSLSQSEFAAAMAELPQPIADLVRQARPRVRLDKFEVAAAGAALNATGEVTLNPQSEKAGPGQFTLGMENFGTLMAKLSTLITNQDDAKALLAVALIRGFADPEQSAAPGRQTIRVEIDDQGKVTANGIDLMKLIALME